MHFGYSDGMYQQNDDVTKGSPLDPALASVFMVELETSVIATLGRSLLKIL